MNQYKRLEILTRLRVKKIHSTTNLVYNTHFEFLIAVLLSAQSTDASVNQATAKLYAVANTPASLLELGINGIKGFIKNVGLFNKKAENIVKTCHSILDIYNGEIPENREALEALPGVGRKTANVVLNVIFGWPTIAVDAHVFRVCNRTRFALGSNVSLVEKKLIKLVPAEFKKECHDSLIFLGRYTCAARKPLCFSCAIEDLCEFKEKIFPFK